MFSERPDFDQAPARVNPLIIPPGVLYGEGYASKMQWGTRFMC